jgi:hypothetical protein
MTDGADRFKKQPRRKGDRGRSISVTPEMRKAYEDEIKAKAEREAYERHLPNRDRK